MFTNIYILNARGGNTGNCQPEKINVDLGEKKSQSKSQFPMLHSRAINIYNIIMNVINKIPRYLDT